MSSTLHALALGLALATTASSTEAQLSLLNDAGARPSIPSGDAAVTRSRLVRLDETALGDLAAGIGETVRLDLLDDLSMTMVIEREIRRSPQSFTLVGYPASDPTGSIMISVNGDVLRTSIESAAHGSFAIRSNGDGLHVVESMAVAELPGCGFANEDGVPFRPSLRPTAQPASGGIAGGGVCAEDGSVIDLLVVYTDDAVAAEGGTAAMEALINLGVDQTNTALANSGVATTVRLVGIQEVAYAEGGSSGTDLARLVDPADGLLDEVHALRDALSADVVSMITDAASVCGVARLSVGPGPTPLPEEAFNVVARTCATAPIRAFAHELGHNLGCLHDRAEDACDAGTTRDAKGYIEPGLFATIMAYGSPTIDHFSNPNVTFGGMPTGIPAGQIDSADNAGAIMLSAPVVASFRSLDCNGNGVCDDDDITGATSQDCNANGIPDECETDCNGNGIPDDCDISGGASVDGNGNGLPDDCEATRLYVDAAATGANLGTSWIDARTDLQQALTIAAASNGAVQEIWVAAGTYVPGPAPHRAAAFSLISGVAVHGGFAGDETSLDQRDPIANETILSGDLLGDDGPDFANNADNALTVVLGSGTDSTAVLDGFTVTGGNIDTDYDGCYWTRYAGGGGIRLHAGSATIRNCRVLANSANGHGGGLFLRYLSDPVITGCDFIGNRVTDVLGYGFGGGASVRPDLGHKAGMIDCRFIDNFADGTGAGVGNICIECEYVNCAFLGNQATKTGGAVQITGAVDYHPSFTNCVMIGNSATNVGGAIYAYGAGPGDRQPRFTNCTIVGNSAAGSGGASFGSVDIPVIDNCILWGNWTTATGSMGESAQMNNFGQAIANSTIQGWTGLLGGVNNDGLDPMFVDMDGPDDVLGTEDDDVRLSDGSPSIDSGDDALLPADTMDLDGDLDTTEALPLDHVGNARVIDGDDDMVATVDRGALELGELDPCVADLDGDSMVATTDLLALLAAWGPCPGCPEDLDGDGQVATTDLLTLLASWGGC